MRAEAVSRWPTTLHTSSRSRIYAGTLRTVPLNARASSEVKPSSSRQRREAKGNGYGSQQAQQRTGRQRAVNRHPFHDITLPDALGQPAPVPEVRGSRSATGFRQIRGRPTISSAGTSARGA